MTERQADHPGGLLRYPSPLGLSKLGKMGLSQALLGETHGPSSAFRCGPQRSPVNRSIPCSLPSSLKPTDLSVQAASLIMDAPEPLEALIHLSQDFPKYSAAVARKIAIPSNIQARADAIAERGQVKSSIFINGAVVAEDQLNAFSSVSFVSFVHAQLTSTVSSRLSARKDTSCYLW